MWHLTLHKWVGDPARAVHEQLEAHLRWMQGQQMAGRILMAGPTPDRSIGIMVFGHMSTDEVDDICRGDPFVAHGFRTYEVIPWDVHHVLGIGGFDPAAVAEQAKRSLAHAPRGSDS